MRIFRTKHGMTLSEILLAVIIMAAAFLPVIGVLSSSMNATEKDENTIRGISLCQEKINAIIQFPYDKVPTGNYSDHEFVSENTDGTTRVKFGTEIIGGVEYISKMNVASETVIFKVPTCDFEKKGENENEPDKWDFSDEVYTVDNMVKRYNVTVYWHDSGKSGGNMKSYTLSTLKADIRK